MDRPPIGTPGSIEGDGQGAKRSFMGHILMKNRNALIAETELTQASGSAERDAALAMI